MAKPSLKGINFPGSLQHFTRFGDPSDWIRGSFFIPNMWREYYYRMDDFDDSTMVATRWSSTAASGTAFAYNAQRNGALRGATGAVAAATVLLIGNKIYDPSDNPAFFVRFLVPSAVTSTAFEIGWQGAVTSTALVNTSALTAAAVPTIANTMADGAFLTMNTGYTLTTSAVVGIGTSTTVAGLPYGTYTPTVSKWVDVLVVAGVAKSYVRVWDNGVDQGGVAVASGPDAGTLVAPYFLWKTIGGTTRQIDIDVAVLIAERNAA